MRDFNKIDPVSLKAFYYSAQANNFTKGAICAGLTQSGVSQHIARLEADLDVILFKRGQRIIKLTEAGSVLYAYAEDYLDRIDHLLHCMEKKVQSFAGKVSYGMPSSCLKTPHFAILLERRQDFSRIELDVNILDNQSITNRVLDDSLDFGFVTKKINHTGLEYREFAIETYIMVGTPALIDGINAKTLLSTPFVNYPGMEALLEYWQKNYYPRKRSLNINSINIQGEINDLNGAITMCEGGVGVAIFPIHCVENELNLKNLKKFSSPKSSDPAGSIYIIHRKKPHFTKRVEQVLNIFWDMK